MNDRFALLPSFFKMPIVGIVRNMRYEDFTAMLPVYCQSGLRNIEVTMNTPRATDMIRYAVQHFGDKLIIGAGTVCTQNDLRNAMQSGAKFIVSPITDKELIDACVQQGIPAIPGAYTPTEIYKAWNAGAALVKLFPATSLGPQYIKDVKAALSHISIMPTGGVDHTNLPAFFKAGAAAVGIGSHLFPAHFIREKNEAGLLQHFKQYVQAVHSAGVDA